MPTLSVPLTPELEKFIKEQVESGDAASKAHVVRKALKKMMEDQVVDQILKASKEPNLRGDLDVLARKLRT